MDNLFLTFNVGLVISKQAVTMVTGSHIFVIVNR